MTDYKAIALLAKKLAGEATPEELAELDHLLTMHPESIFYTELLMQVWQEGKTSHDIPSEKSWQQHIARFQPDFAPVPGDTAPVPFYKRRALRLALVVFLPLIVAAGIYIWMRPARQALAGKQVAHPEVTVSAEMV